VLETYANCGRLVVIPLSFLRRLDSLKYTSIIALVSITYLVILVLAHFIKGDTGRPHEGIRYFETGGPVAVLSSFPVIVFAYTCHQNVCLPPTSNGSC
jgi:amino acid permease